MILINKNLVNPQPHGLGEWGPCQRACVRASRVTEREIAGVVVLVPCVVPLLHAPRDRCASESLHPNSSRPLFFLFLFLFFFIAMIFVVVVVVVVVVIAKAIELPRGL
uniref:Transmembrane protein n=1 Tax=Physcomitrium patens TaxID=3218 RepID=A0A2K1KQQ7_PHYPA|nr:hypothetical protein PHYPA_006988 [Physcomitrium patens]